jgi:hypothetical protein
MGVSQSKESNQNLCWIWRWVKKKVNPMLHGFFLSR